ncbi:MAG: hypothetical protein JSR93_09690 [Verrucomicrobia bacterium]|nr:hypothetical protein [Verrucomicrobiota bacterium]
MLKRRRYKARGSVYFFQLHFAHFLIRLPRLFAPDVRPEAELVDLFKREGVKNPLPV